MNTARRFFLGLFSMAILSLICYLLVDETAKSLAMMIVPLFLAVFTAIKVAEKPSVKVKKRHSVDLNFLDGKWKQ